MANRTKVLEINDSIHGLVCVRCNNEKYNPYRLYLVYPDKDKYVYPTRHRKQLAVYGDMASVICHIRDLYIYGRFQFI